MKQNSEVPQTVESAAKEAEEFSLEATACHNTGGQGSPCSDSLHQDFSLQLEGISYSHEDMLKVFEQMLQINSTSAMEKDFAQYMAEIVPHLSNNKAKAQLFNYEDGSINLRIDWGKPDFIFCSHLDTVPPYIPPTILKDRVLGRGSCDAKGQIFSMLLACLQLQAENYSNFSLLLLSGEETGSFGAKAYDKYNEGGKFIVVGEPTDNKMVTASKGTKAFAISIFGKSAHSGYPHLGESAVDLFVEFCNKLAKIEFPKDEILGESTYNIGKLHSDNPQNILSDRLDFRLYFRTTFASDSFISEQIAAMASEKIHIEALGGDQPMHYEVFEGIDQCTVSFGSDTPRLSKFPRRALCGPGSIFVAHTDREFIRLEDIAKAKEQYIYMFKSYLK